MPFHFVAMGLLWWLLWNWPKSQSSHMVRKKLVRTTVWLLLLYTQLYTKSSLPSDLYLWTVYDSRDSECEFVCGTKSSEQRHWTISKKLVIIKLVCRTAVNTPNSNDFVLLCKVSHSVSLRCVQCVETGGGTRNGGCTCQCHYRPTNGLRVQSQPANCNKSVLVQWPINNFHTLQSKNWTWKSVLTWVLLWKHFTLKTHDTSFKSRRRQLIVIVHYVPGTQYACAANDATWEGALSWTIKNLIESFGRIWMCNTSNLWSCDNDKNRWPTNFEISFTAAKI